MTEIYSARWVLPISSPPIEYGAVAFDRDHIVGVDRTQVLVDRFADARVTDFGDAAILPGLVNAHSHLELTVMRGFLEREERDFFAWLRKLTVARLAMSPEDLFFSAACGAVEAARAGVTCVGDASSSAATTLKALRKVGLRGIVYQESFGPDETLARENVAKLKAELDEASPQETALVRAGVSPHAIYTVSGPQLELISRLALDEHLPLMMHAAESRAEELFVREGSGPFAEGLKSRGINWQAPGISTIEYLKRRGVLEAKPLLAHCIAVDEVDINTIKHFGAGIAHCPKSNAKLGHGRAPFAAFLAAGVRVGFGSDSVASNNICDLLEEARFATLIARLPAGGADAQSEQSGDPASIAASQSLFAATLGGARAMGIDDQVGALQEGMQADLTIVGLGRAHQRPEHDPEDTLVFTSSGRDVLLTMVAGTEVYRNGHVVTVDEVALKSQLQETRTRLDQAVLS